MAAKFKARNSYSCFPLRRYFNLKSCFLRRLCAYFTAMTTPRPLSNESTFKFEKGLLTVMAHDSYACAI